MPTKLKKAPLPPQSMREQLGVPEGVSDSTIEDMMQPWQPKPQMEEMFSPLEAGRELAPTALEVGAGVGGAALAAGTGIPGLIGAGSLYTLAHNTAEKMRALNRGEAAPPTPTLKSVGKDFLMGSILSQVPVTSGPLGYVQQGATQAGLGQAQNLMEGRPLNLQQAGEAALMGTAFHGGFQGTGKALAPLARKAAPLFEGQRVPMTAESGSAPIGKPQLEPWQMTKKEFDKTYWFHGKSKTHPLYGKPDITGGATSVFDTAKAYAGTMRGEEGDVYLIKKRELGQGARQGLVEEIRTAREHGIKRPSYSQVAGQGSTPITSDISVPSTVSNPHLYLIEKALAEGKRVPLEVLEDYPELKNFK